MMFFIDIICIEMQLWSVIEFGRIWESPIFYPMPGPTNLNLASSRFPLTSVQMHPGIVVHPQIRLFEVSLICVIAITRALIGSFSFMNEDELKMCNFIKTNLLFALNK